MIRRLTAATAIAVAMLALSACRSSPQVAAYVGNTEFKESDVTVLVDDAATVRQRQLTQAMAMVDAASKAKQAGAADADSLTATADATMKEVAALRLPTRETIVQTLVYGKVCDDLQTKQKFPLKGQVAAPDLATSEQVPAASQYVALRVKMLNCLNSVPATPVKPTEAELREVYDNGVRARAIDPTDPAAAFDKIAPQLTTDGQLAAALGVRQLVVTQATATGITLSPRYRSLTPYPALSFQTGPALEIVLGQPGNPAVVNGVSPAPATPAAGS